MRRFLIATNMLTLLVLVAVLIVMLGFESQPVRVDAAPPQPEAAPQPPTPKIAAFNMEKVLRDFKKGRYEAYLLEEERNKLSLDVAQMKTKLTELQSEIKIQPDINRKEALEKQHRELARQIEDKERENDKKLNEKSVLMNSSVYDQVSAVANKLAEVNGYDIVFAYSDVSNPLTYLKNKEAKLKPPAAQPIFLAKHVDLTEVVIQTLNYWYPQPEVPIPSPQRPENPMK
jgi:Skp family chaperone for outer membrane proteins